MSIRRVGFAGLLGTFLTLATLLSIGCGGSSISISPPYVENWEIVARDTWISVGEENKEAPRNSLTVIEFTSDERNAGGMFDRVWMYITVNRDKGGQVTFTRVFMEAEVFPYHKENISGSRSLYFIFYPEEYTEILRSDGSVNFNNLYSSFWERWETAMPALDIGAGPSWWYFKPTGTSPYIPPEDGYGIER